MVNKKQGVIYKIETPANRIYIGQKQTFLYRCLKKYDFEKHKFDILHTCNISELDNLEIFHITKYNSFNKNNVLGLNLTEGGGSRGRVVSDCNPSTIRKSIKYNQIRLGYQWKFSKNN